MTPWISICADWISGDWRPGPGQGRNVCDGCVWAPRCGVGHANPAIRGDRPDFAEDIDMQARMERLLTMLEPITVRKAVIRDCHASIVWFLHRGDFVYHIDEHGDDELYDPPEHDLDCGNWRSCVHLRGVETYKCIPETVTDRGVTVANVFIALSRVYTPRAVDEHVFRLLDALNKPVDFDLTR